MFSKQDNELFCESDSIETVLSAFSSIYSSTTVGSLAVIAFVSSLYVHCFIFTACSRHLSFRPSICHMPLSYQNS